MNILIADDDPDVVAWLELAFKEMNHSVDSALAGDKAWTLIQNRQRDYDLILLDLQMPGLDGLSLLQRLHECRIDTPVAMISGRSDSSPIMSALRLQAFDFLVKPLSHAQIVALLKRWKVLREVDHVVQISSDSELFYQEQFVLKFSSRLSVINSAVKRVIDLVRPFHAAQGKRVDAVALALTEAVTNAIMHGNYQISGELKERDWDGYFELLEQRDNDPEYARRMVTISVESSRHQLKLSVSDEGSGFEVSGPADGHQDIASLGGRGITLMRHCMDQVEWSDGGRCVHMSKSL